MLWTKTSEVIFVFTELVKLSKKYGCLLFEQKASYALSLSILVLLSYVTFILDSVQKQTLEFLSKNLGKKKLFRCPFLYGSTPFSVDSVCLV